MTSDDTHDSNEPGEKSADSPPPDESAASPAVAEASPAAEASAAEAASPAAPEPEAKTESPVAAALAHLEPGATPAESYEESAGEGDVQAGEAQHDPAELSHAAGDRPAGAESPAKKRRRRRKKKNAAAHEGAPAADGAEGVADGEEEGAEGEEGAAEGGEGAPRRRRGIPPMPRERPAFTVGEEVFGRVVKVTEAAVWIDIAAKATGLFDRREITEEETPQEGDQFIATVASTGVRGGMLMMSRLPVVLDESKKYVEAALGTGEAITGFVTGAVKGGLEVDIGGLRAFAPASHVDLRHGADLNYLVGERLDFIVTQYAKKGRDIVVSRRKMLEDENRKLRAEAMKKIESGSVQKGIVRKVVAWGVFVSLPDAGNVEGLVHMTEASHDRGARLEQLFKPGQEIEVKILRVDEKGKLWLSRKAVVADPWDAVREKYAVGSRHKGKVARLQPFGAFIELEPGIDGLIHTADLSLKQIEHPSDVVKVGDEIDVVVVSTDPGARKIGLHPALPESEAGQPRQKIAPHKAVKVAVVQTIEQGLVVRVLGVTGRLARGFIPAGHTGTVRGTDLRKTFPIGTELEAKVIEIDPRRGEAKLSIRALKDDAEKQAYQQYRSAVARESKFGTFADLMKKSS
jgi:small subunit ribosomal protein S1